MYATVTQSSGGGGDVSGWGEGGGGEGHTANEKGISTSMRPHRATLWTKPMLWEPLTTAKRRE
eukprot:scaffold35227_cov46-Phaeocystis_antarctica.AAC.6